MNVRTWDDEFSSTLLSGRARGSSWNNSIMVLSTHSVNASVGNRILHSLWVSSYNTRKTASYSLTKTKGAEENLPKVRRMAEITRTHGLRLCYEYQWGNYLSERHFPFLCRWDPWANTKNGPLGFLTNKCSSEVSLDASPTVASVRDQWSKP